ncbi:MAG TPA: hypothetical protein VK711_13920 [Puia sp.]|jgi:hypothetical protein|nr:hypothetical protein [Puia sp.]
MELSEQIIQAIKNSTEFEYSEEGHTITIEGLDELLPNVSRHLIVGAIVDMDGVVVIDSHTGTVKFPASYFI